MSAAETPGQREQQARGPPAESYGPAPGQTQNTQAFHSTDMNQTQGPDTPRSGQRQGTLAIRYTGDVGTEEAQYQGQQGALTAREQQYQQDQSSLNQSVGTLNSQRSQVQNDISGFNAQEAAYSSSVNLFNQTYGGKSLNPAQYQTALNQGNTLDIERNSLLAREVTLSGEISTFNTEAQSVNQQSIALNAQYAGIVGSVAALNAEAGGINVQVKGQGKPPTGLFGDIEIGASDVYGLFNTGAKDVLTAVGTGGQEFGSLLTTGSLKPIGLATNQYLNQPTALGSGSEVSAQGADVLAYTTPGVAVIKGVGEYNASLTQRAFDIGVGALSVAPIIGDAAGLTDAGSTGARVISGLGNPLVRTGVGAGLSATGTAISGGNPEQIGEAALIGGGVSYFGGELVQTDSVQGLVARISTVSTPGFAGFARVNSGGTEDVFATTEQATRLGMKEYIPFGTSENGLVNIGTESTETGTGVIKSSLINSNPSLMNYVDKYGSFSAPLSQSPTYDVSTNGVNTYSGGDFAQAKIALGAPGSKLSIIPGGGSDVGVSNLPIPEGELYENVITTSRFGFLSNLGNGSLSYNEYTLNDLLLGSKGLTNIPGDTVSTSLTSDTVYRLPSGVSSGSDTLANITTNELGGSSEGVTELTVGERLTNEVSTFQSASTSRGPIPLDAAALTEFSVRGAGGFAASYEVEVGTTTTGLLGEPEYNPGGDAAFPAGTNPTPTDNKFQYSGGGARDFTGASSPTGGQGTSTSSQFVTFPPGSDLNDIFLRTGYQGSFQGNAVEPPSSGTISTVILRNLRSPQPFPVAFNKQSTETGFPAYTGSIALSQEQGSQTQTMEAFSLSNATATTQVPIQGVQSQQTQIQQPLQTPGSITTTITPLGLGFGEPSPIAPIGTFATGGGPPFPGFSLRTPIPERRTKGKKNQAYAFGVNKNPVGNLLTLGTKYEKIQF